MSDEYRDEPRSQLYRRQAEEARREIETWPLWMQYNLRMWSETTDSVGAATQMVPRVVLPDDGHGRGKDDTRESGARQMLG